MSCAAISQSLASAIGYNCPYFPKTGPLLDEFDEWYVKVLKIVGVAVAGLISVIPFAIAQLCRGTKWEREKLLKALEGFEIETEKAIKGEENDIRNRLKNAIGYRG